MNSGERSLLTIISVQGDDATWEHEKKGDKLFIVMD